MSSKRAQIGVATLDVTSAAFTVNLIRFDHAARRFYLSGAPTFQNGIVDMASPVEVRLNGKVVDHTVYGNTSVKKDSTVTDTGYAVDVPIHDDAELTVWRSSAETGEYEQLDLTFTSLARIGSIGCDYRLLAGYMLRPTRKSLCFKKPTARSVALQEALFFWHSLRQKGVPRNVGKTLIIELLRIMVLIRIGVPRRSIWIFSDRAQSGGDNSEAVFRYAVQRQDPGIRPVFAVNKGTPTYERLKRDGYEVVAFKSIKHLYYSLLAQLVIPSHLDINYLYAWPGVWQKYAGLLSHGVVHTQHGVVTNDMARYVGKHAKNADIFLSICSWERSFLTNRAYGYSENQVPITGAPRYDELEPGPVKRVIAIHPTWRSWLVEDTASNESATFAGSDYHTFYQRLLNDDRLVAALVANDYELKLYVHPNHASNVSDFVHESERVSISAPPHDYTKMFREASVFVTDYSNTAFDVAYLKKPIVYAQFDADAFFSKQASTSRKVFDYDKQGFGPLCTDYESTVAQLILAIEADPVMAPLYQRRVREFFDFDDKSNAGRAYEAITAFARQHSKF